MKKSTKRLKTFQAWGIPFGKGTEEVTIQVKAYTKKEAKEKMTSDGTKLVGEIYQSRR